MARKKSQPFARSKKLGLRAAKFQEKLAKLRSFTSEFDSDRYERAFNSHPRSAAGKAEKKKALSKVSRTFARLRPYIHRPHKIVRPTSKENFESLRKYVGMGSFKGLRAIPVATDRKGTLKVAFDKKHRPILSDGAAKQKVFLFPHTPRNVHRRGKLVGQLSDDILAMTDALVKKLPRGQYVLFSKHHFLMPTMADRDELSSMMRAFVNRYTDPEFLKSLRGFKWISGSYERAQAIKEHMATERGRMKHERQRVRAENAARAIAAMDRQFKRGVKQPKISKRARMTGRR